MSDDAASYARLFKDYADQYARACTGIRARAKIDVRPPESTAHIDEAIADFTQACRSYDQQVSQGAPGDVLTERIKTGAQGLERLLAQQSANDRALITSPRCPTLDQPALKTLATQLAEADQTFAGQISSLAERMTNPSQPSGQGSSNSVNPDDKPAADQSTTDQSAGDESADSVQADGDSDASGTPGLSDAHDEAFGEDVPEWTPPEPDDETEPGMAPSLSDWEDGQDPDA